MDIWCGRRPAYIDYLEALQPLRLVDAFTNAESLEGRTGAGYIVSAEGRRMLPDRKIGSISSGMNDPKIIRIYYTYDKISDRVIVGWLPTHLQTGRS